MTTKAMREAVDLIFVQGPSKKAVIRAIERWYRYGIEDGYDLAIEDWLDGSDNWHMNKPSLRDPKRAPTP